MQVAIERTMTNIADKIGSKLGGGTGAGCGDQSCFADILSSVNEVINDRVQTKQKIGKTRGAGDERIDSGNKTGSDNAGKTKTESKLRNDQQKETGCADKKNISPDKNVNKADSEEKAGNSGNINEREDLKNNTDEESEIKETVLTDLSVSDVGLVSEEETAATEEQTDSGETHDISTDAVQNIQLQQSNGYDETACTAGAEKDSGVPQNDTVWTAMSSDSSELMSYLDAARSISSDVKPAVKSEIQDMSGSSAIEPEYDYAGGKVLLQVETEIGSDSANETAVNSDPVGDALRVLSNTGAVEEKTAMSVDQILNRRNENINKSAGFSTGGTADEITEETEGLAGGRGINEVLKALGGDDSLKQASFLDTLKKLNLSAATDAGTADLSAGKNVNNSVNTAAGIPGSAIDINTANQSASGSQMKFAEAMDIEIGRTSEMNHVSHAVSDKSVSNEFKLPELAELQKTVHLSKQYEENAKQIAEKINIMLAKNLKEAELNLDPAGLGKMKISLQLSEDGVARVNMIVQQSETKDLVYESMNKLREFMERQGFSLGDSSVEQQESWAQNSQNGETSHTKEKTFGRIAENGREESVELNMDINVSERTVDYFA